MYADNDYKSAERQFDAALRIDPTNPEALVGKAGILIQRKEPEKALRQLSLVSGTDAASPEVLYNKALAMYQMGLTDDAGTDLGTYAREHPNDAEAQNALGVVMLRAGNYASAAHLDRAIALRPEQGEYYYNRANVLKEQKEFKAAIDDYTRAVAFIPDLAGAYINRGDVFPAARDGRGLSGSGKSLRTGECDRLEKYEDAGRCRDFF
ncbi:MAG: tetratricopeptide repeat protein [Bilophila wadsworthia]